MTRIGNQRGTSLQRREETFWLSHSSKLLKPSWFLLCSEKVTSLWIIYGTCHDTALKNAKVSFTGRKKSEKEQNGHIPYPNLKDKTKEAGLMQPLPRPSDASSRKWGPVRKATSLIPSEACFLHNGLFYNLLWLLISHYELRFWQESRFWGRKRKLARNVSRVGNSRILLLLKSSRKE